MRAGKRNRLVTIQTLTTTRNSIGHPEPTWADYTTVWANVLIENATERTSDDRTLNTRTYRFTTLYREDISTGMRVVLASQTIEIEGVLDPDGKRKELVIIGLEVQPDGA